MDWDDFGYAIVAIVIVATFSIGTWIVIKHLDEQETIQLQQINNMGYNPREVKIFCSKIDSSLEDFIASPGIQKQYEAFRDGKTTDFMKQAEANKNANETRSGATAAGIAAGMVAGSLSR